MKQDYLQIPTSPGYTTRNTLTAEERGGEAPTPPDHKNHMHRGAGGQEPPAPQNHKSHRVHRGRGDPYDHGGMGSGSSNPGLFILIVSLYISLYIPRYPCICLTGDQLVYTKLHLPAKPRHTQLGGSMLLLGFRAYGLGA